MILIFAGDCRTRIRALLFAIRSDFLLAAPKTEGKIYFIDIISAIVFYNRNHKSLISYSMRFYHR